MMKINEVIIVEGKYDAARLKKLFETVVITTNGFQIFNNESKIEYIRRLAENHEIMILTDSDDAGLVIRNHLKGYIDPCKIKNAYVPMVQGKEKRKRKYSKQGLLGVEGMTDEIIINAVIRAGCSDSVEDNKKITKSILYEKGLSGHINSKEKRKDILEKLGLPTNLTCNAFMEALNSLLTKEEIESITNNE